MTKIHFLILISVFFISSCDNGQTALISDEESFDETVDVDSVQPDDDIQPVEYIKIMARGEKNGIVQNAELDLKNLKVERNFNHVDTSFSIHIDDLEKIIEIVQTSVCEECREELFSIKVFLNENDFCCINDENTQKEIQKYLMIPVTEMFWPFAPTDESHNVGHTAVNIQHYTGSYEEAYFHHGVDVIKENPEKIFNPYDGRVKKIGYYRTEEVGESKYYFEVAVQTVNGLKFEFHHTDPESVPDKIYDMEGTDKVLKAGENTGKIVFWPTPDSFSGNFFHHIHFNVITENGIKLNPLILMIPQEDDIDPEIEEIFIVDSGKTKTLSTEDIGEDFHVVIKVSDFADNNIWPNPPRFSNIEIMDSGNEVVFEHSGYDFIAMMGENINEFVCDYYLCEIGETVFSKGNYSEREFYIVVTAFDKTGRKTDAIEKELFEIGEYLIKATSCDEVGNCGEKTLSINL